MARTREFDTDKAISTIADTFWADGYEATGIADLVEATGVGRASLYGAFGSKQEMLHLAVERYLDTDVESQWAVVDGGGVDGATHMFRQFAMFRETRPERAQWGCLMVNSIVELGRTDPSIVDLGGRYRARIRHAFRTAYETAVENGEIAPGNIDEQVELSTMMIMGCFVAIKGGADLEEVQSLTGNAIELIESWRIAT
ncbi:MAG: TetR/AcrR family transcriptional regulator [Acidimicrobiia bacterium]